MWISPTLTRRDTIASNSIQYPENFQKSYCSVSYETKYTLLKQERLANKITVTEDGMFRRFQQARRWEKHFNATVLRYPRIITELKQLRRRRQRKRHSEDWFLIL